MDIDPHRAPARQATSGIPPETYGGLSPDELSRTIIAYDSGHPNPAGWPLGYAIWVPGK